MIFLRALVIFIQLLTFGSVTLATFEYKQVEKQSFYSMTFQEYLDNANYSERITLTNLIQNGGTLFDLTGWYTGNSNGDGVVDVYNGNLRLTNITDGVGAALQGIITSGTAYYVGFNVYSKGENSLCLNGFNYTTVDVVLGRYSNVLTASENYIQFQTRNFYDNDFSLLTYISIFASGNYTKTQIDTALSNYGYLTYNVLYELIDETDINFQTLYTEFFGSYTDFTVSDLSEIRYYGYTMTKAEIGLTEIVILAGCIFGWVVFIGIMRRLIV